MLESESGRGRGDLGSNSLSSVLLANVRHSQNLGKCCSVPGYREESSCVAVFLGVVCHSGLA